MAILKYYVCPGVDSVAKEFKRKLIQNVCSEVTQLNTEYCYYVQVGENSSLTDDDLMLLKGILMPPQDGRQLSTFSHFNVDDLVIEIGPRLNFSTSLSTNAVSICQAVGLKVSRVERSVRYHLISTTKLECKEEDAILGVLYDRMTETRYEAPLSDFNHGIKPEDWYQVDIFQQGKSALEEVNSHLGLALDDWDLDYYYQLFLNRLKRNPTSVECFDLAQSNSEHSRHWFFKGRLIVDGRELPDSLMDMIVRTQKTTNPNSIIQFSDNSSAIYGHATDYLVPKKPGEAGPLGKKRVLRHITFTAETHNFPTGVCPFSGATTGTGGRIRDNQAVGRGGHVIAATVGYSFGNLLIPDYDLPWEDSTVEYPANLAAPLQVAIEASNGASDYGNKFGEPVLCGFARSFGLTLPGTLERREWVKPIMFSGGIGQVDDELTKKMKPEKGMRVIKIGGPAYRIGLGGGAASSLQVQGDNRSELDYGAVQRGDAEMEQKMNRLLRACIELGADNLICSIHDQGAGGNGNVLKEIVEPEGAVFFTGDFQLGDPSLSTMELWGAEYQESNAILCRDEDVPRLQEMARRERCPISVVGRVTGNGRVIVCETSEEKKETLSDNHLHPVDLPLSDVLENMPRKIFHLQSESSQHPPVHLDKVDVESALQRVLRLPSIASKRYLTNKVDRSVTGLVAQQQCVGPLHTPLADVAVVAASYFDCVGSSTSIGEQPIKGLVSAAAGARMSLAEALTNLVWSPISDLRDVKCSGNWMWPAKLPGEGAAMVEACAALCNAMSQLGVAIDGGKDSLSMAARMGTQVVKAPGTVVISAYAPCPDVRLVVTPDFKLPADNKKGSILLVDLSQGSARLGGSALAQCYQQIGNSVPDMDDPLLLTKAFNVTQELIKEKRITTGHDISDGGLIVCLLEMAFAGVCGFRCNVPQTKGIRKGDALETLFAEELGFIIEVESEQEDPIMQRYNQVGVPCFIIGHTGESGADATIEISINGEVILKKSRSELMRQWEETSYQLDRLQANSVCIEQEFRDLPRRNGPRYQLSFDPDSTASIPRDLSTGPVVAVIREEGTNGDREMSAALMTSGFQVWDINTQDLIDGSVTLDRFKGIVFPGGFSFADALGSAKGWATSLTCRSSIREQLEHFRNRSETFSLGVCNGCQLMALLGWLNPDDSKEGISETPSIFLDHNQSGRYESRFTTVRIESSKSILLRGLSGTQTGVWVAHGEGRFIFRDTRILDYIENSGCVALRYVDDDGEATMDYPMNPNGSVNGIAGLCSKDGRHLAMMPHPERCIQMWQFPWKPKSWEAHKYSPWKKVFDNAFEWVTTTTC